MLTRVDIEMIEENISMAVEGEVVKAPVTVEEGVMVVMSEVAIVAEAVMVAVTEGLIGSVTTEVVKVEAF